MSVLMFRSCMCVCVCACISVYLLCVGVYSNTLVGGSRAGTDSVISHDICGIWLISTQVLATQTWQYGTTLLSTL